MALARVAKMVWATSENQEWFLYTYENFEPFKLLVVAPVMLDNTVEVDVAKGGLR